MKGWKPLFLGEIAVITAGGLEYHQRDILSRKKRKMRAVLEMRVNIRQLFNEPSE
jgi:hypothetical protein